MNSRFIPNSFIIPNSVVDELMADMSGVELKCYLFVVRKTKGWNKECDAISLAQFVKFTGAGKTAVVDALKNLVDLGLLVKKTGVRNTSVYAINSFGNQTSSESELVQKANSTSSESELVTSSESEHTKYNIKNNIQNTNKKNTKKSALDLLADFGITGQLADDFIVLRKAKKAPITETALKGYQSEADKAGISICEAVAIAIKRNWQGFNADWNWQGVLPNNQQTQKMTFAEKNAQPWNRPEDWKGVF